MVEILNELAETINTFYSQTEEFINKRKEIFKND